LTTVELATGGCQKTQDRYIKPNKRDHEAESCIPLCLFIELVFNTSANSIAAITIPHGPESTMFIKPGKNSDRKNSATRYISTPTVAIRMTE
jgi:hypothetical protein